MRLCSIVPVLLSTTVCLFFVACGGGDEPPPVQPDLSKHANELQQIAASMQNGLNQFVGSALNEALSSAQSGSFDIGTIFSLLGQAQSFSQSQDFSQYLTNWQLVCNNPSLLPTTGMNLQDCHRSFWTTLGSIGMGTVVGPLQSVLPQAAQLQALLAAQTFLSQNPSGFLPPGWGNSLNQAIVTLGSNAGGILQSGQIASPFFSFTD